MMKLFAIALSFGAALAADAAEKARLQAALPPAEKVAVVAADPAAKAAATAAPMEATMCTNFCVHSRDGDCDDGGPGSEYSLCSPGTDCADCGRCSNTCAHRFDGDCDDGGFGSEYGRKPRHSPATSRRPARPRLSACNWRGSVVWQRLVLAATGDGSSGGALGWTGGAKSGVGSAILAPFCPDRRKIERIDLIMVRRAPQRPPRFACPGIPRALCPS